jgi:hypothetical protein
MKENRVPTYRVLSSAANGLGRGLFLTGTPDPVDPNSSHAESQTKMGTKRIIVGIKWSQGK